MEDLSKKACIPCEGGIPPLLEDEVKSHLVQCPLWQSEGRQIFREFEFADFKGALEFVNKVGNLAEAQKHHPDIEIHWNRVILTLWTHTIDGLSENDFIMACKIDRIF